MYQKKIKLSFENLIYGVLGFWLSLCMVSMSTISLAYPQVDKVLGQLIIVIRLILIGCAFFYLAKQRITLKKLGFYILFTLLVLCSYKAVGSWWLFDMFFITIIFGDILTYKKIVNIFFRVLLFATCIIILLSAFGILPEYMFQKSDGHIRYSLGFIHPNSLGFIVMMLCLLYILKKNKIKISDTIILSTLGIVTFIFSKSETSMSIILLVIFIITFLQKLHIKYTKKKLWIISILFFVSIVTMVYLIAIKGIGSELIYQISDTLYTRFRYGHTAIMQYGFSSFGQYIKMSGDFNVLMTGSLGNYFTLDCIYFYLPIVRGVIPTLFFTLFYLFSIKRCIENRDLKLYVVMLLLLLYGISETTLATIFSSYLFLIAVCKR